LDYKAIQQSMMENAKGMIGLASIEMMKTFELEEHPSNIEPTRMIDCAI